MVREIGQQITLMAWSATVLSGVSTMTIKTARLVRDIV